MKSTRARYTAQLMNDTILVEDANDGAMSVTNDAEAVVDAVVKQFGNFPIKYKDTDGNWDWLVHKDGVFLRFAPGNEPYPKETK